MNQLPDEIVSAYRSEAVIDRQIDELIGIVKGVMADGSVSDQEADFLLRWMDTNRKAANVWPAKALYPRLAAAMADGKMDINEEREILDLLMKTVGGNTAGDLGIGSCSTQLPLSPLQPISFSGRSFCFTGAFTAGTRRWCETQVEARGGTTISGITKKLNYLVIGDVGNMNWIHSTHGRKIEKAVFYNSSGCEIAILSEEHWYNHL